jgi:Fic family protein
MEALMAWFTKADRERSLHPLLLIGSFIVIFLTIHPFQDGNDRLSRVLATLMLLRAGYAHVPYSSLERIIEASKEGSEIAR